MTEYRRCSVGIAGVGVGVVASAGAGAGAEAHGRGNSRVIGGGDGCVICSFGSFAVWALCVGSLTADDARQTRRRALAGCDWRGQWGKGGYGASRNGCGQSGAKKRQEKGVIKVVSV